MLNWIMFYTAQWLLGPGGPLNANPFTSTSADVHESARLPVFWGLGILQGAHVGLFLGIAALVVYSLILNRTTLGYEVRAVGFNPDAARYGGISVARSYFLAMAIAGTFAGLAGAMDVLGWEYRLASSTISLSQIGFLGIAVALLGRNTAIGTGLAALLFGALLTGTSQRNLDPSIFKPELASNLSLMIQGLVVLFVGADLLILYIWNARKKVRRREKAQTQPEPAT
jgi:simple sugar transport system permease protein